MDTGLNQRKSTGGQSGLRAFSSHLAAMAFSLSLLVLGELVLRLLIPPPAINLEDPFVSFSGVSPLFELDESGSRFETAEERLVAFRPQSFAASKGKETFRIFCLGGSTVQGRPYSVETSFTTWLKLNLGAACPGVEFEVINCGGISYASYRLVTILRELLEDEPDLFIIYTGHNEFLEDRTYQRLKIIPPLLNRIHMAMLNLRSYALANRLLASQPTRGIDSGHYPKTVLPPQVQTKLDFEEGLESFHRDEQWRQGIIGHFHRNLESMVLMARRAGVPVILMNPVSNIKDCPPFKSEFRSDLSESLMQRVVALQNRAGKLDWSESYGKIRLLEEALSIDSEHAGILYQLGNCYTRIGRVEEAKKYFILAKEEDICPLRILEPMHKAILDVTSQNSIPLVDVKGLIEKQTEDGIPGDEWLLDHIHPNIAGHQLIADALFEVMVDMEQVCIPEDWRTARDKIWQRHISSLNNAYYARGTARLQRLREWSRNKRGRTK